MLKGRSFGSQKKHDYPSVKVIIIVKDRFPVTWVDKIILVDMIVARLKILTD